MGKTILTPSNMKATRFEVSGLDEYMERVKRAGNSVDDAVADGVAEIKEEVKKQIEAWAESHDGKYTGAVANSVEATDVIRVGNQIYAEIGIDGNKEPGGWHAVFVEYGTPHQAADPGIRNAFFWAKKKSKEIYKKHFKKRGLPHD